MLLVTAAATESTTTNPQMVAHYDFQIRQQHQPSTFHGPARQFGSGGMGAFACGDAFAEKMFCLWPRSLAET